MKHTRFIYTAFIRHFVRNPISQDERLRIDAQATRERHAALKGGR